MNILLMPANEFLRSDSVRIQCSDAISRTKFLFQIFDFFIIYIFYSISSFAQNQFLDPNFGTDGISLIDFAADEGGWSIFTTSDDKIVASGWSKPNINSPEDILLLRTDDSGNLDTTFHSGNVISVGDYTYESVYSSIAQSDGKILVCGRFFNGENWDMLLARFFEDGFLDTTFAVNGFAIIDISSDDRSFSIDLQKDGRIVISGFVNRDDWDFTVLRFNSNGSIDSTFGENGVVIKDIDGGADVAFSVKVQEDGKIIACGWTFSDSSWNFLLARYNSDGSFDQSFGENGIVITDVEHVYNTSHSVAIQEDGKYVVTGYRYFNDRSDTDILLARYNIDGSIDQSFGINGLVTTDIDYNEDFSWDLVIQPNNKIVVTGYTKTDSSKSVVTLRYLKNGTLDSTFEEGGIITTSIFGLDEEGRHVTLQSDGKILVTGYSFNGLNLDLFIIRYKADATNIDTLVVQDSSFTTLFQNYPNPFRDDTFIKFRLTESNYVVLKIYDLLGQEIYSLIDEPKECGEYRVPFNARGLSSGIYFCKLTVAEDSFVNKMIIVR